MYSLTGLSVDYTPEALCESGEVSSEDLSGVVAQVGECATVALVEVSEIAQVDKVEDVVDVEFVIN